MFSDLAPPAAEVAELTVLNAKHQSVPTPSPIPAAPLARPLGARPMPPQTIAARTSAPCIIAKPPRTVAMST